ncbi:MAG: DUF3368 domain-containing protein [Deltaproteobacteria bacterium]|nr:DUF3368 domain-containing protein [Deltaproteobacteria bacterium]
MFVVANSSVLIALCRIRMLELLHQRYPEGVFIPKAVWREVVEGGKGQPGANEVSSSTWIKVKEVEDRKLVSLLGMELDQGEAEAIVLASEQEADLILLDEKAARRVAKRLGLAVLGTVGVLIYAKRAGFIGSLKEQLDALQEEGNFRIASDVYNEALRVVSED